MPDVRYTLLIPLSIIIFLRLIYFINYLSSHRYQCKCKFIANLFANKKNRLDNLNDNNYHQSKCMFIKILSKMKFKNKIIINNFVNRD